MEMNEAYIIRYGLNEKRKNKVKKVKKLTDSIENKYAKNY